jgi:hypothetical protein
MGFFFLPPRMAARTAVLPILLLLLER